MKRRTFPPEQKANIVLELLKENKTIAELAAEYQIQPNQLQHWKSEAFEKMHRSLPNTAMNLKRSRKSTIQRSKILPSRLVS